MTNNKIDEIYENMLNISDTILSDDINDKIVEKMKDIESSVAELDNIEETAPEKSNRKLNLSDNVTLSEAVSIYNPQTGLTVAHPQSDNFKQQLSSRHFNALMSDNDNTKHIDINILSQLDFINKNPLMSENDVTSLARAMEARMSGETSGLYEILSDNMKNYISGAFASASAEFDHKNLPTKNHITMCFVDSVVEDYQKMATVNMDLDTALSGFDDKLREISDEFNSSLGSIMVDMDNERKSELEKAIERCEKEGNSEGAQKLKDIKEAISEAFELTKFKEFCRECRIKAFDYKKPSRVFDTFNQKYINHSNIINDIRDCPNIMDNHIIKDNHNANLAVCLAFCKYCTSHNLNPSNILDHTFMYYFVRNIIMLDRINPRGMMGITIEDKFKDFYNTTVRNLTECAYILMDKTESNKK